LAARSKRYLSKPGLATIGVSIQGKRVKYLNPLQLYIFITTVFFLVAMSNDSVEKNSDVYNKASHQFIQARFCFIAYRENLSVSILPMVIIGFGRIGRPYPQ
jgi:hypothetical protein